MNRRHFLGLLGTCSMAVAGCLESGSADTPPQANATEPPSSTSASADSRVEVPPCPDRPESFTHSSVLEFAIQFEKSHLARKTLQGRDDITSIDVRVTEDLVDKDATRAGEGWASRFTVIGPAYRTTSGHVDPPLFVANYFIGDERVLRAAGTEAADPREEGTAVDCPPDPGE